MRTNALAIGAVLVLAAAVILGPAALGGADQLAVQDDTDSTATTASTDDDSIATDDGNDLDLREANVIGVSVTESDGSYTFDVTLFHDDDGEEGYANWWQVERLDGTQLGRRDLAHPHGTQEFTRSETIEIPDDATVVVRGHDQTHGYGGQAWLVNLETGDAIALHQGSDRMNLSGAGTVFEE